MVDIDTRLDVAVTGKRIHILQATTNTLFFIVVAAIAAVFL
jgi:hypothetical protein